MLYGKSRRIFRTTTEQHNANVQGAEDMQLAYVGGKSIAKHKAHANSIEQTWISAFCSYGNCKCSECFPGLILYVCILILTLAHVGGKLIAKHIVHANLIEQTWNFCFLPCSYGHFKCCSSEGFPGLILYVCIIILPMIHHLGMCYIYTSTCKSSPQVCRWWFTQVLYLSLVYITSVSREHC